MRRIAAGVAVLVLLGSVLLLAADALLAEDVVLMAGRREPADVAAWRALRDPDDDPVEIHGVPLPGGTRRLHVLPPPPRDAYLEIREAPGRRLLFVDEHPGLHLVDARALRGPAVGAGLLSIAAALVLRRKRARTNGR